MLTIRDIRKSYPARIAPTPENIGLACQAMELLWNEREAEYAREPSTDRSGSCKFAALMARSLFGGRLAGNLDHVFVVAKRIRIDLNGLQADVTQLGAKAYIDLPGALEDPEYRDALHSCVSRTTRWIDWVLSHPELKQLAPSSESTIEINV